MKIRMSAVDLLLTFRHLYRLAVSVVAAVVFALSGLVAALLTLDEATCTSQVAQVTCSTAPIHKDHTKCVVCGRSICAGHDALLFSASPDAALLPAGTQTAIPTVALWLTPPRAPPRVTQPPASPFHPRGPPQAS